MLQVATGRSHACAVLSDSNVYCWGSNDSGQLGDGTTSASAVPVSVGGEVAGRLVSRVAVGTRHTCAETAPAVAYCWGANESGQLGNGSTADSPLPVLVRSRVSQKADTPVVGIAAGNNFSSALLASAATPGAPTDLQRVAASSLEPPRLVGQGDAGLTRYQISYRPVGAAKSAALGTPR